MTKRLVHVVDENGRVVFQNLIQDSEQDVMRFMGGHGSVSVDECKQNCWSIVPGVNPGHCPGPKQELTR